MDGHHLIIFRSEVVPLFLKMSNLIEKGSIVGVKIKEQSGKVNLKEKEIGEYDK